MRIELSKNELLFDIRNKSHNEVSVITDAEVRYRAEAGTDKLDEIERDIISSLATLSQIAGRYSAIDMTPYASNSAGLPDYLVLDFTFSERRLDGKAQALTDAIHSFLVDNTLALFYETVSLADFQTKRAAQAAIDAQLLEHLIFTKKPPYMTRHI